MQQPTFQTPWERLERAKNDLLACGAGNEVTIRPIIFLCGLKLSFSYFKASQTDDLRAQWLSPGHLLDDGLNEAARRALAVLIKIAKSRDLHRLHRGLPNKLVNPEVFFVTLAFLE